MFDKFKQSADMIKAANKVRQIQNQLSKERFVIDEKGVKVVFAGGIIPKVKSIEVDGNEQQDVLIDTLNKGYEQAQKAMATKMQEMGGGLSGLF